MCGRYTLLTDAEELAAEFGLSGAYHLAPRYNIAPSQGVPVIRISEATGRRCMDVLRWGLVPHWANDPNIGFRTINARAETIATQPAFRESFRKRRCLVPANGFYEWQKTKSAGKEVRQPYYIQRKDGRPLALAGLWDRWEGPNEAPLETFTVVTTNANELVGSLHDRMPVILLPEHYDAWLNPNTPVEQLKLLLAPFPSELLTISPVGKQVNNPRNDDPSCIAPASNSFNDGYLNF